MFIVFTYRLRCDDVDKSSREQDKAHGEADPRKILKGRMGGQVPKKPKAGCETKVIAQIRHLIYL